jgi:hypothetical protein
LFLLLPLLLSWLSHGFCCHSERSEETPYFALAFAVPLAVVVALCSCRRLLYPTKELSFRPKLLTLHVSGAVEKSASLPPPLGRPTRNLAPSFAFAVAFIFSRFSPKNRMSSPETT